MLTHALQRRETDPLFGPRLTSKAVSQCARVIRKERELEGHEGCVNTVAFTPDGTRLLSGSDDQQIKIWDWTAGECVLSWDSGHTNNVFQARTVGIGPNQMVSCAADGQVRLHLLSHTGKVKSRRIGKHAGRAHKIALDPAQLHTFYSSGEDAAVRRYDIRQRNAGSEKLLVVYSDVPSRKGQTVDLNGISVNPTATHEFAVGGDDEYCYVFDTRMLRRPDACASVGQASPLVAPLAKYCPGHLASTSRHPHVHITACQYSRQGELLVTYNDDDIYLFHPWLLGRIGEGSALETFGGPRRRGPSGEPSGAGGAGKRRRCARPAQSAPEPTRATHFGGANRRRAARTQSRRSSPRARSRPLRSQDETGLLRTTFSPSPDRVSQASASAMRDGDASPAAASDAAQCPASALGASAACPSFAAPDLRSDAAADGSARSSLSPGATWRGFGESLDSALRDQDPASASPASAAAAPRDDGADVNRSSESMGATAAALGPLGDGAAHTSSSYHTVPSPPSGSQRGEGCDMDNRNTVDGVPLVRRRPCRQPAEGSADDDLAPVSDVDADALSAEHGHGEADVDAASSFDNDRSSDEEDGDGDAIDDDDIDSEEAAMEHERQAERCEEWAGEEAGSDSEDMQRGYVLRRNRRNVNLIEPRHSLGATRPVAPSATWRSPQSDCVVQRFSGHRNLQTVKGVNFLGEDDEYIVSGSDCGHLFIWSKRDGVLRNMQPGDERVLNCLEPHPRLPLTLATSGIDSTIKIWTPDFDALHNEAHGSKEQVEELEEVMRNNCTRASSRWSMRTTPMLLHLMMFRQLVRNAPGDEDGDDFEDSDYEM